MPRLHDSNGPTTVCHAFIFCKHKCSFPVPSNSEKREKQRLGEEKKIKDKEEIPTIGVVILLLLLLLLLHIKAEEARLLGWHRNTINVARLASHIWIITMKRKPSGWLDLDYFWRESNKVDEKTSSYTFFGCWRLLVKYISNPQNIYADCRGEATDLSSAGSVPTAYRVSFYQTLCSAGGRSEDNRRRDHRLSILVYMFSVSKFIKTIRSNNNNNKTNNNNSFFYFHDDLNSSGLYCDEMYDKSDWSGGLCEMSRLGACFGFA